MKRGLLKIKWMKSEEFKMGIGSCRKVGASRFLIAPPLNISWIRPCLVIRLDLRLDQNLQRVIDAVLFITIKKSPITKEKRFD